MIERDIEIKNKLGLHARAAAKFVHTAARFKADIKVRKGDVEVDGTSSVGIRLGAGGRGSTVRVRADGEDERDALDAVEKLIDAKFDEVE